MRINITIPDSLLSKVDAYCTDHGYHRSVLIQELLRERLFGNQEKAIKMTDGKWKDGSFLEPDILQVLNDKAKFKEIVEKEEEKAGRAFDAMLMGKTPDNKYMPVKGTYVSGEDNILTVGNVEKVVNKIMEKKTAKPFDICPKHKGFKSSCGCE